MASRLPTLLIIGGTGAQGIPIAKLLSSGGKYNLRIQTRDPNHERSRELATLPNTTLVAGRADNEADLRRAFEGVTAAFVNTNGFAIGEKAELYWGMRIFEIAKEEKSMRHYVWSNLDYALKLGGYDEKYKTGHYDGKGRVAEWIQHQPCGDGIGTFGWTIFTNGPYMEMLVKNGLFAPRELPNGVFAFAAPVGNGHVCMIALDDLAFYVDWIFSNPDKSTGMDLAVATEDVAWDNLVKTFMEVTGHKAVNANIGAEEYFSHFNPDAKAATDDPDSVSFIQNFSGFWSLWRDGIIKRDYKLLDSIHPNRLSLKSWMEKHKYNGVSIDGDWSLKQVQDGGRADLRKKI